MQCVCTHCHRLFERKTAQAIRSKRMFCSNECWGKWLKGRPRPVATIPVATRFWSKVNVRGEDDCWTWAGAKNSAGYGHFNFHGKTASVHRVAWELSHAPIGPREGHHGICVCHSCDNRLCVNPRHLFLGSHTDNIRDMESKGRAVHFPGSTNYRAKLTDLQVLTIRADHSRSNAEWAIEYGVSKQTIRSIRTGKTWRHLAPGPVKEATL